MAAHGCALVNLLCVLEACRKDLAIHSVILKLTYDLSNNCGAVTDDVVKSVNVGCYEISSCLCSHKSLSGSEDSGHGNTNAQLLEHHSCLKSLLAYRDLNVELTAKLLLQQLCFLNYLFSLGLSGLNVEHLVLANDGSDVLNQLPEVSLSLCDDRGVGGNTCKGVKLITMLYCRKISGVKNVYHLISP